MSFKEIIIDAKSNENLNFVDGSLQIIETDGLSIDYACLEYSSTQKKELKKKEEHIELFFMLQGAHKYYTSNQTIVNTNTGKYGFFYLPEIDGNFDFVPYEKRYHSLGIEFSLKYLEDLFKNDLEILGKFGQSLYSKDQSFFADNITIPQNVKWVINEILQNPYDGVLKKIYLESKINELLLLILTSKKEEISEKICSDIFNKNDVEKLYYIREIISKNIENPYSLKSLSRISGLNEFKLKKGFKELFNCTVFQYIFQEKMELGRKMILETQQSITEIATNVGYKNATHFTSAFKKHYNILPSQLRK